jgi:ubiquinone/menaquinone biosynthesis C-methylase UbiE
MTTNLDRYQRIAGLYDILDWPFEAGRYRRIRPRLFAGLEGRILDAGVGTGRNIAYYPPGADMVGIDFSPAMLERARRRAEKLGRAVDLRRMDVTALDLPPATFDAVVATFLFCVLPDEQQPRALGELSRVLKPGGTIRILEYVRPKGARRAFVARLWEPWMNWAYGAGFDRNTEAHVRAAGFEVTGVTYVVDDIIKLVEARNPLA